MILTKYTTPTEHLEIDGTPISSHAHSPIPLTNLSPPLHFPLLRYPLPPLHLVVGSGEYYRLNRHQEYKTLGTIRISDCYF